MRVGTGAVDKSFYALKLENFSERWRSTVPPIRPHQWVSVGAIKLLEHWNTSFPIVYLQPLSLYFPCLFLLSNQLRRKKCSSVPPDANPHGIRLSMEHFYLFRICSASVPPPPLSRYPAANRQRYRGMEHFYLFRICSTKTGTGLRKPAA